MTRPVVPDGRLLLSASVIVSIIQFWFLDTSYDNEHDVRIYFAGQSAGVCPATDTARRNGRKQGMAMAKKTIDRRVARTRALLHEALLSLIAEKRYETITVEEICARVNTGRSTFYAHYTGKDDLMRSGFKQLRAAIQEKTGTAPGAFQDRGLAFSLAMFEHVRDHAHLHGGRCSKMYLAWNRRRHDRGICISGPASTSGTSATPAK